MLSERLEAFIRALPDCASYSREDLLLDSVLLEKETAADLTVYDAPAGWINLDARLVLIGVTPGFTQMEIMYRETRRHLLAGVDPEEACRRAKYEASFGGSMRTNLVKMLDELGLHEMLGTSSSTALFGSAFRLLHTTSAVRYPTFYRGKNYSGSQPPLIRSPFLMRYAREVLAPELSSLSAAAFVPLGDCVADVLACLEREAHIPPGRTLYGFPHPSAANGHRVRKFGEAKDRLKRDLRAMLQA